MLKTSLPQIASIVKIIKENFRTKTFVTDTKIKSKPGQFMMLWLPGKTERPFSLTCANPLTFTIMTVGKFTQTLNTKLKAGSKIYYRGPLGKGYFQQVQGKKIIVSGGCGCVPLYFLGEKIKDRKSTTVIIGARTKKELLFEKKFSKLGYRVITTTDDGSKGIKGYTPDILEKLLQKNRINCVYSSGPKLMLKKIAALCEKQKVAYQLCLEALMKCGMGICGSCVCGSKLVCQDGPVFKKYLE